MVRTKGRLSARVECSGRVRLGSGLKQQEVPMSTSLHKQLRQQIEKRIVNGELRAGDNLPSERSLQAEFDCARSVVRQALQALTRDGWIMPVYPKGYVVIGERIPWISRFEPTRMADGWKVSLGHIGEIEADKEIAATLLVKEGDAVINRSSLLSCKIDGEPWGLGEVYYPEDELTDVGRKLLLTNEELTYDDLELAHARNIVGFIEEITTRLPTKEEAKTLKIKATTPVFEMVRIARTATDKPISFFKFIGRSDRFKLSYAIKND